MTGLPEKAYYRVDELAIFWDVSERVIRLWIARRKLDAVRLNGTLRVPREAVVTFIQPRREQ